MLLVFNIFSALGISYLRMFLNIPFANIDLAPCLDPLSISYPTTLVIKVPSLNFGRLMLLNSTPNILIRSPSVLVRRTVGLVVSSGIL